MPQHNILHLTGKQYGKLTVTGLSDRGRPFWKVLCACGNTKEVRSGNLQAGTTVSCGCHRIEKTKEVNTRHGHRSGYRQSKAYRAWCSMLERCTSESSHNYAYYGGRGIKVCEEWRKFENFLNDMGEPESSTLSLDRIDVNGNYSKENCRWATATQQARNRRTTIYVSKGGEKIPLMEACATLKLNYSTVQCRIQRLNWPVEKALSGEYSKWPS